MLYYGDKYRKINPLTSEILNLENKLVEIDFFFFRPPALVKKSVNQKI